MEASLMASKALGIGAGTFMLLLIAGSTIFASPARAQVPPFLTMWGTFGSGNGQFYNPVGVTVDAQGHVFVVDQQNNRVQKFSSTGVYVTQFGGFGGEPGQLKGPYGVAGDAVGNVYVTSPGTAKVEKYSNDGAPLTDWNLGLVYPIGVAIDPDGNVLVVDAVAHRVEKFTSTGGFIGGWATIGSQFSDPFGIAVDGNGIVYVSCDGQLQKFTTSGSYLGQVSATLTGAKGVAVDINGDLFVTEPIGDWVKIISPSGSLIATFGDGSTFQGPLGIAVDFAGNIYVADTANQRIQKFGPLPTPTTATSWGRLKRLYH
jgi:DNA-binding beta-propeller fold protein YncE